MFISTALPEPPDPNGDVDPTNLLPFTRTNVLPDPSPKLLASACPTLSELWLPKPPPEPFVREFVTPIPGTSNSASAAFVYPLFSYSSP